MTKRIIAIWAEDKAGLIGADGSLPWHLPKELQHFKKTTMGQALLMGRVTFDGMNRRVLPGRDTLILTQKTDIKSQENLIVVHSVAEALEWFAKQNKSLFIVGGASVYKAFSEHYDALIKTTVDGRFTGDTYFPELDLSDFHQTSQIFYTKDDKNAYNFSVTVLEK
ncbi:dihydrofolate reductase [Streptococcus pantholopis]|uniref:Dihydrofolate reductase n=1 Tax=Streptococcus pantholopis TaxID=1811193 RepID=A0A172Q6W0_9STRE|nr:dihydrofolate reductase [Streptococcus pantholopis]AND79219.1 dihydrofolate reductase [Streptococcus pantholopis]